MPTSTWRTGGVPHSAPSCPRPRASRSAHSASGRRSRTEAASNASARCGALTTAMTELSPRGPACRRDGVSTDPDRFPASAAAVRRRLPRMRGTTCCFVGLVRQRLDAVNAQHALVRPECVIANRTAEQHDGAAVPAAPPTRRPPMIGSGSLVRLSHELPLAGGCTTSHRSPPVGDRHRTSVGAIPAS